MVASGTVPRAYAAAGDVEGQGLQDVRILSGDGEQPPPRGWSRSPSRKPTRGAVTKGIAKKEGERIKKAYSREGDSKRTIVAEGEETATGSREVTGVKD